MGILRALSETFIGRALIAGFFDLPRWALANLAFALALLPAWSAATSGWWLAVPAATLPIVPVLAGMINMAAGQVAGKALRLRDALAHRSTLFAVFAVWAGIALLLTLFLAGLPSAILLVAAIFALFLLVIGIFAMFIPSLLKVNGLLIWRNALVLAASYPIVGLGLAALGVAGLWLVAVSKGALIFVVPSLWVVLGAFSVQEQINAVQSRHVNK